MCASHTLDPQQPAPAAAPSAWTDSPWRTLRVSEPIDRLASAAGLDSLLAQAGDRLYQIQESTIDELRRSGEPLDLDRTPGCRRLAENIDGDWRVEPRSATLVIVRRGGVEKLSLRNPAAFQRIATPPLPGTLTDVRVTPDNRRLLCITRDESDVDMLSYEVHLVDAEQRKVIAASLLRTSLPPRGTWSPDAKAFIVFDPCGETMWRIGPDAASAVPVDLARAEGRAIRGFYPHPGDRWFALELLDAETSTPMLLHGWWTPDGPVWDRLDVIDGPPLDCPRWRPGTREMACVRQDRRRVRLERIDSLGCVAATCQAPRGWCITDLAWSGPGDRVYAVADTLLGVWNLAPSV